MVDGSSTRNPSGKKTAFMTQCFSIAFAVGVLVPAYYDRPVVAPQVENDLILFNLIQQMFFQSLIVVDVETIGRHSVKPSH